MSLAVYEIIERVRKAESRLDKIAIMHQFGSYPLLQLLRYTYDPRIKWLLPDGEPPYKPLSGSQVISSELMFMKEVRTLYLFVVGGDDFNPNLRQPKREMLFIDLLEQVHPEDAKLILAAKNRSIPGIERSLVLEAFPGLLPAEGFVEKIVEAVQNVMTGQLTMEEKLAKARERKRLYAVNKRAEIKAAKAAVATSFEPIVETQSENKQ